MPSYNPACLTIVPHSTPDPYVVRGEDGKFYFIYTAGDHIQIWSADDIPSFKTTRRKIIIWRPKMGGCGIWAPELHAINGRWWVLFASDHPGKCGHRMFILAGPPSNEDPCRDIATGAWTDMGHVQGMATDQWAIDGTFFHVHGQLYMVYAGGSFGGYKTKYKGSELMIVRMASPTQTATSPVVISRPLHAWEREGQQGINEGPQWLESPDGSWKGIVYSAGGSWCQNYKEVILQYLGGDPLMPGAWRKDVVPLLVSAKGVHGPFGPGHGNFVHVDGETFNIFHATDKPNDGWANRKARMQRVQWTREGPYMGGRAGIVVPDIQAFRDGPGKGQIREAEQKTLKDVMRDAKAGYKKYTSGW